MMRSHCPVLVLTGLSLLLLVVGCRPKTPASSSAESTTALARWHSVGADALRGQTNATCWQEISALPVSRELAGNALDKLARTIARATARVEAQAGELVALLRPLADDFWRAESFGEIHHPGPGQSLEWWLAVRLDAARGTLWQSNLARVAAAWSGTAVAESSTGGATGWQARRAESQRVFQIKRVGDWLLLSVGQEGFTAARAAAQRLQSGQPLFAVDTNAWLSAWINGPKWAAAGFASLGTALPETTVAVVGVGEYVRTRIEFNYPRPLAWTPEPWRIPTNLIREPLVSFGCVQGLAPWLQTQAWFQPFLVGNPPNQLFYWGMAHVPFQMFAAAPVTAPSNMVAQLAPRVASACNTNLVRWSLGSVSWNTNLHAVVWEGIPMIVPMLQAVRDESGEFLFASMFPNNPQPTPLPAELLAEVTGDTNVVYYDWELTGERLDQWRHFGQLLRLIMDKPQWTTNLACFRWSATIATNLGNTVTKAVRTAPNQISIQRKSHLGLTGIELYLLADWLEAPEFPGCLPPLLQPVRASGRAPADPTALSSHVETRRQH